MTGKKIESIEGLPLRYYNNIYNRRNDLSRYLVHLTKPTKEEIEIINKKKISKKEKIREIEYKSIDNLIRIIKEKCINGSNLDGYIINGSKKTATCFQEVPFCNLKENVNLSYDTFLNTSKGKLRYSSIGLAFDRFTIYKEGGRPVIYEDSKYAKEMLDENEYWRIVNLKLDFDEPKEYYEEICDEYVDPENWPEEWFEDNCIYEELDDFSIKTKIIDFTYEREWRVPNHFYFSPNYNLTKSKNIILIFPNEDMKKYFEKQIIRNDAEQSLLFEKYPNNEDIYTKEALENIKKYGTRFYLQSEELMEILPDEVYKPEFLDKLYHARELDQIDFFSDFNDDNIVSDIKYVILEDNATLEDPKTLILNYTKYK